MPKNPLPSLPFPPLEVLDQDAPVDADQLNGILASRGEGEGASILVRSETGHPSRGGYFFHYRKSPTDPGEFELFDFSKARVAAMSESEIILLINHCSGRQFSEASYSVCQNEINLRDDH